MAIYFQYQLKYLQQFIDLEELLILIKILLRSFLKSFCWFTFVMYYFKQKLLMRIIGLGAGKNVSKHFCWRIFVLV